MNIFFLTYAHEEGIRSQTGGIRKVRELGNAMAKLGHLAVVFLPKNEYMAENDQARHEPYAVINIPILRPLSAYLAQLFKPLWFSVRSGGVRPDVVYFRTAPTILPLVLSRLTRAKFVIEINGDILGEERGRKATFFRDTIHYLRGRLTLLAERINCRYSDVVVTLTEGLKETVVGRYGIQKGKVFVVASGTNTDHCRPLDMNQSRESLSLEPDKVYINFIGVLYRHQGIDTLIEAAPLVIRRYPDVVFLIGGGGPMLESWHEKVKSIGIQHAFRFLGVVPFERLPFFLNAATLCVAPFRGDRGETSPLKIMDYLACAKPVVCSDIASLRPLVKESAGILPVKPDDPEALAEGIGKLLEDDARRVHMGQNGRRYIEQHHRWEIIAQRTIDAIQFGKG